MDYKYGNKNNWRRWQWNRIAERVPNRATATVLYLAGEADLDRKIAVEHGFRDNNLIAIEKDRRTLSSLRNKGVLAVHGEFSEIVQAWPHDRQVEVVIGDFCCGLEYDMIPLAKLWAEPPFFGSVFAFNFLRGRDPSTNQIRSELISALQQNYREVGIISEKHRGVHFLQLVVACFASAFADTMECDAQQIANDLEEGMWEKWNSYKSSANQIFDSIVFRSPLCGYHIDPIYKDDPSYIDEGKGTSARRHIAAILAHQTMRSNDGLTRA